MSATSAGPALGGPNSGGVGAGKGKPSANGISAVGNGKIPNGKKSELALDSEVNEWSELLTNEQEVATVHPVELPPNNSYNNLANGVNGRFQGDSNPGLWRLPPKAGKMAPNRGNHLLNQSQPRDWIELRATESPPSVKR